MPDIQVLNTIDEVRACVRSWREAGNRVGLVPTMGALHDGHMSLVQAAREQCDRVLVTIFVNPTQFGPGEDLERYPRTLEADLQLCEEAGVTAVFVPDNDEMYPEHFTTYVDVEGISSELEGSHRDGHFRGVTTVVLKLFLIAQADYAFFGAKDYQQQLLIRLMCRDLNVPIEIVTCPTVREADGLALSSRNRYLSASERETALVFPQTLQRAAEWLKAGVSDIADIEKEMRQTLTETPGIELDYAVIRDAVTLKEIDQPVEQMVILGAIRLPSVRLIDNVVV
ncbi:pantoate--beta-alanine ligase [Calycomorphotria hydatis]|uniref:Pantothenate synthetase n=1 Tax=Calycomorphotria hydatis TaxID=2528027 RepID=A0A517TDG6_9PLAN|nr:pantoate--beta-alanine ligase [Calycomorphotria hydatis]QDT66412.1 Pantoate-beta-alanine ligase [Calycomorphotria hydatis]